MDKHTSSPHLLLDVLDGKERCASPVLVCDSTYSLHVHAALVRRAVASRDRSMVVCVRRHPSFYQVHLSDLVSRLTFIDCFTDPLAWQTHPEADEQLKRISINQIFDVDCEPQEDKNSSCLLVDDLQLLLRKSSFTRVCEWLRDCASKLNTICFVNPDLVDSVKLKSLAHISSACLDVALVKKSENKANFRMSAVSPAGATIKSSCLLKRTSRKVLRSDESYHVVDSRIHPTSTSDRSPPPSSLPEETRDDPAANLTFNLRLSENERTARADVSLPYLLDRRAKTECLVGTDAGVPSSGLEIRSAGSIIYQPDEADDFDDEDPDDDLDI